MKIVTVREDNVYETGFFCFMSKRKNPGLKEKSECLKDRFKEGLVLEMIELPDRGMIEYIPADLAWRPVQAAGYMFIHCLCVVGKSKGQGYAKALLDEAVLDAKKQGFVGICMTVSNLGYMKLGKFLANAGFRTVDSALGSYELMALDFGKAAKPSFAGDWDSKAKACGSGVTMFASGQCPYLKDFADSLKSAAEASGRSFRIKKLNTAEDIRKYSPTPYGVCDVVVDGKAVPIFYETAKYLEKLGS